MQTIITNIMNRIKQESTWRGIILIFTAFGVQIAPELQEAIITVGLALVGAINIIKDK
jgi:hypothetical protein